MASSAMASVRTPGGHPYPFHFLPDIHFWEQNNYECVAESGSAERGQRKAVAKIRWANRESPLIGDYATKKGKSP